VSFINVRKVEFQKRKKKKKKVYKCEGEIYVIVEGSKIRESHILRILN